VQKSSKKFKSFPQNSFEAPPSGRAYLVPWCSPVYPRVNLWSYFRKTQFLLGLQSLLAGAGWTLSFSRIAPFFLASFLFEVEFLDRIEALAIRPAPSCSGPGALGQPYGSCFFQRRHSATYPTPLPVVRLFLFASYLFISLKLRRPCVCPERW